MTRRLALLFPAVLVSGLSQNEDRAEVLGLVSPLASALSNGDVDAFLRHIPDDSPNRTQLARNIRGLLGQAEITSSVQLKNLEKGRAELDWYMEIRSRATQSVMERRKQPVIVTIRNGAIFSLEPVDFFKPAEVR